MRAWLRGEGHTVPSRGRIRGQLAELYYDEFPDRRPEGSVRLLPSPGMTDDEIAEWEDLGELVPSGVESDAGGRTEPTADGGEPPGPVRDPEPAHGRKEWRKGARGKAPAKTARVTVGVRTDINAKISFALEIPGRVWQARDPTCGGTFVEQRPQIADALTEIVCQSSDLVAWFSGSGGQFMLYLNLAAACWPVATVVMAHHVYHTIEAQAPDAQQPDWQDYAA